MIMVLQCAASKMADAGHMRQQDGSKVMFVGNPATAPSARRFVFASPDDVADTGSTWRDELKKYNKKPGNNPWNLLPAWKLYQNPTYALAAKAQGLDKLFILSAGWGLLKSSYLTPNYDITFSASAEEYKRRRRNRKYQDFCMLPDNSAAPIVFFGGKDYIQLFCSLTSHLRQNRYVFYNSASPPDAPGCTLRRFQTTTRTNWHYECVRAFVAGAIGV